MGRYVTWLGQLGTIKALSLQPYLSAVTGFFKDHGLETFELGDLVAKVENGLAASHVAINETLESVHMPASVVLLSLRMAQALRIRLFEATTGTTLQTSAQRVSKQANCEHVRQ
jgi:hypothetical protein